MNKNLMIVKMKIQMQRIYSSDTFPTSFNRSIFLAGPTPRDNSPSWRIEACELLKDFDDVIFIPEYKNNIQRDYDEQMKWELNAMKRSDIILFWFEAEKEHMPALTTRVELGYQLHSGKVIFGAPANAYKSTYIEKLATQYNIKIHRTLDEVIMEARNRLNKPAFRTGAETLVPHEIWLTRHFQEWYQSQRAAGHALTDVQSVEWTFRVGPSKFPLFIAMHVSIQVYGENRIKSNEVVIIRPSISSICVYSRGFTTVGCEKNDDRIVLVKEYRTPVMNSNGFVFELAGGSSFKTEEDAINVGIKELAEETGITLPRERFRIADKRQIAATMIANQAVLLAVELTNSEMNAIEKLAGTIHGNEMEESERTHLCVFTRKELFTSNRVDYAVLGMISTVCDFDM